MVNFSVIKWQHKIYFAIINWAQDRSFGLTRDIKGLVLTFIQVFSDINFASWVRKTGKTTTLFQLLYTWLNRMLTKRASNLVRGLHQQPHAHEWLARDPYSADSHHLQPDTFYEPRLTQVSAAWNHHFRTHFRHNPHHFREEHVFPPCWSYDHTHNALLKKLTHQRSSWTAVIRREILNLTLCSCCRSFLSKSVKF